MILVFEQDTCDHGSGRFNWHPHLFRGRWDGRRTWRFGWGLWSLSYYPSPGLREFFDHVESGATEWRDRSMSASSTYIGRCACCGDDLFDPEQPVGFRVSSSGSGGAMGQRHRLERVDVGDRRPWAGVRLVCSSCLVFFWGIVAESKEVRPTQFLE